MLVSDIASQMVQKPEPEVFSSSSSTSSSSKARQSRGSSSRRRLSINCNVCGKSYDTQRDFTNHKRRKGFCRPPARTPPKQTRRIGIIRKSL